jgi:transposase
MKAKQTKIQKLINALYTGSGLTVREIASRFRVPNVYAIIDDIRKVHGYTVKRGKTVTGKTYYYINPLGGYRELT